MQWIFSLASVSRPALGPTQPPVQWVSGVLSPGVKRGREVTLTTRPHLSPRSRMSRSYTSSPLKRLCGVWWDCFYDYRCKQGLFPWTTLKISACNGDGLCSLWGMDWILKIDADELRLQRLTAWRSATSLPYRSVKRNVALRFVV
jgi:hypothetical protein